MDKHLVFVYGTLRRDASRPMLTRFPGSKFVAAAEVKGSLYDLGDYPALLLNGPNSLVTGEVYEVDGELLNEMDAFEAESDYHRKQVEISTGTRTKECWTYTPDHDQEFYSRHTLIASGDWVEYLRTKTDRPADTPPDEA